MGRGEDLLLVVEALEAGGGDLQTVESDGSGFTVEGAVGEGAKHLVHGEVQAVRVLDEGEAVVAGRVGVEVEVAVVQVAQGGSAAGLAVKLGVEAAWGVIELGNGHGTPPGGAMKTKGVEAGIPGKKNPPPRYGDTETMRQKPTAEARRRRGVGSPEGTNGSSPALQCWGRGAEKRVECRRYGTSWGGGGAPGRDGEEGGGGRRGEA